MLSTKASLVVLVLVTAAVSGGLLGWPPLVIAVLLICAVLGGFVDWYIKRPTRLPTAPTTLSCSGCKKRDRRIRWTELAGVGATVAVGIFVFYLERRG